MALRRCRMATARRIQSRRRVRFCLPNNEPDHTKEIRWKEILLESEDPGTVGFHREMLHLCKGKGELAYMEAKEQFDRDVLLTEDYYNGIIACKIGGQTVKNLVK